MSDTSSAASMTDELQRAFAESLTREERVLIIVRDELYGGSWDELLADLTARQNRKPYIFKLNSRIDEDLNRIAKLRTYEQEQEVDLHDLLRSIEGGAADTPSEGIPL